MGDQKARPIVVAFYRLAKKQYSIALTSPYYIQAQLTEIKETLSTHAPFPEQEQPAEYTRTSQEDDARKAKVHGIEAIRRIKLYREKIETALREKIDAGPPETVREYLEAMRLARMCQRMGPRKMCSRSVGIRWKKIFEAGPNFRSGESRHILGPTAIKQSRYSVHPTISEG